MWRLCRWARISIQPTSIRPRGRHCPRTFSAPRTYGFAGVTYQNWGATSNYHSPQTTVNRRFGNGLQFGVSWTWSKFLDSADFDGNGVNPFVPARQFNYGLSTYDR